ncbi:MAG: hypothetical protein Q4F38_08450, partial [Akkermansia sp.]|nr:hypothetical protein [Akkermansia sp.]
HREKCHGMTGNRAAVGLLSFASSGSDFLFFIYPKVSLLRSVTLGYYTFAPPCGAFKFGGLSPAGMRS